VRVRERRVDAVEVGFRGRLQVRPGQLFEDVARGRIDDPQFVGVDRRRLAGGRVDRAGNIPRRLARHLLDRRLDRRRGDAARRDEGDRAGVVRVAGVGQVRGQIRSRC
jgi:hypothetical protein